MQPYKWFWDALERLGLKVRRLGWGQYVVNESCSVFFNYWAKGETAVVIGRNGRTLCRAMDWGIDEAFEDRVLVATFKAITGIKARGR